MSEPTDALRARHVPLTDDDPRGGSTTYCAHCGHMTKWPCDVAKLAEHYEARVRELEAEFRRRVDE